MIEELVAAYGNRFLVAALGVSLALLCLFIVLWLLRKRAPSPFVRGGRNRQPRLQVLDAAAVDARRRLVLVRRDNVEHLVMIGGPTDIVIESGIGDERAYLSATPVSPSQAVPLAHEDRPGDREPVAIPKPAAAIAAVRPEPELPANRPEPAAAPVRREPPRQPPAPLKPAAEPMRTVAAAAAIEPALRKQPAPQPVPAADMAASAPPPSPAPIQPVAAPTLVRDDAPVTIAPVAAAEPPKSEVAAASSVEPPLVPPSSRPSMTAATPATVAPPAQTVEAAAPAAPTQDGDVSLASAQAEDILEAARGRVMPELTERAATEPELAPEPRPSPEEPKVDEAPKQRIPSDFERVLEEEMERHLAATASAAPVAATDIAAASAIRPERPVGIPPVGGAPKVDVAGNRPSDAAEEPSLQKEIARIFGEMSASRDG